MPIKPTEDWKLISSYGDGSGKKITNTEYERVDSFPFAGSDYLRFNKVIVACSDDIGGTVGAVRLYDLDNAKVIAEKTDINSNLDVSEFDLGTISNVPNGSTKMELQAKRVSGGNPNIHYLQTKQV